MKTKLGKLTKVKTGKLDANASSQDGEYPFFTCSKEPLKISSYSYDCECVLIAGNGDLNVKYFNGKFDAYQRTYIIEDNSDGKLYMPYLYYFMERYVEELRKQAIGGVIKYIKLGNLTDALIELPDIDTQKKVVKILNKAKHIVGNKTSQIKMLDELIKSRFVEMFGDPVKNEKRWEINNLGDLGYFKNGMNFNQSDEGYILKFLGVGEFKKLTRIDSVSILSELELRNKPSDEYLLKKGDIVFVRSNGSKELVGRSVLIGELEEPATYSGFCIRFRNQNQKIQPDFLIRLFADDNFKKTFKQDSRGANINNLNQTMLSSLRIIVPPIELQNQFADFVQVTDKLKVDVKQKINS